LVFFGFLYILNSHSLSDELANIFSYSVGCPFILFIVYYAEVSHNPIYLFLLLLLYFFGGEGSKNCCLYWCFKVFFTMFSYNIFMALALTFRSLIHFELIFYRVTDRDQIIMICTWICSLPSTIYWGGCPLTNIYFGCLHQESDFYSRVGHCDATITMYSYISLLLISMCMEYLFPTSHFQSMCVFIGNVNFL
jgi:hypothetical protein